MGYSNFKKISQVTKKFGLKVRIIELFPPIAKVEPSDWLTMSLNLAVKMPLTNEKNKSERLVSPILLEVAVAHKEHITLFSGEEIYINPIDDLAGPCDFIFALQPQMPYLETPVVSLTEAKDEDIDWGVAQCAAQIYAAHLLNTQEEKKLPVLYGCATDGVEWQFLKFENDTFYIDSRPMTDLPQILGTWHWIIQFFIKNHSHQ